ERGLYIRDREMRAFLLKMGPQAFGKQPPAQLDLFDPDVSVGRARTGKAAVDLQLFEARNHATLAVEEGAFAIANGEFPQLHLELRHTSLTGFAWLAGTLGALWGLLRLFKLFAAHHPFSLFIL